MSSETTETLSPEAFVREYLKAIQDGATGAALSRFFAEDVVQQEFPNQLTPRGATRDLAAILDGAERGRSVLSRQTYDIHNVIGCSGSIVAEVTWTGTLSVSIGSLPPGGEMKARFCIILEMKDGRIRRQRNYDCFDPF
jgi:ketosteroid isomerase-like protein